MKADTILRPTAVEVSETGGRATFTWEEIGRVLNLQPGPRLQIEGVPVPFSTDLLAEAWAEHQSQSMTVLPSESVPTVSVCV